jgi:hypothetical protein
MVTNSFGNRNSMQPMGRLSMHSKCLDFFAFKFGGGGGGVGKGFFSFFLRSQHVPNGFPSGSQYVPYIGGPKGEALHLLHRIFYFGEPP